MLRLDPSIINASNIFLEHMIFVILIFNYFLSSLVAGNKKCSMRQIMSTQITINIIVTITLPGSSKVTPNIFSIILEITEAMKSSKEYILFKIIFPSSLMINGFLAYKQT